MKGKVIINNQEIDIEINEEQLEQLKVKKKTGYERVKCDCSYTYINGYGDVITETNTEHSFDRQCYQIANYYSDITVAHNNARADKLMRRLRRFAVENRKTELDWTNASVQQKYYIYYQYNNSLLNGLNMGTCYEVKIPGVVYFDSKNAVESAMKKFKDELIWYFTEYKDSL